MIVINFATDNLYLAGTPKVPFIGFDHMGNYSCHYYMEDL